MTRKVVGEKWYEMSWFEMVLARQVPEPEWYPNGLFGTCIIRSPKQSRSNICLACCKQDKNLCMLIKCGTLITEIILTDVFVWTGSHQLIEVWGWLFVCFFFVFVFLFCFFFFCFVLFFPTKLITRLSSILDEPCKAVKGPTKLSSCISSYLSTYSLVSKVVTLPKVSKVFFPFCLCHNPHLQVTFNWFYMKGLVIINVRSNTILIC